MGDVKVSIEGKELVIRLPLADRPEPSKTGKTLVVASTRGNFRTDVLVQGRPVTVGVNAYISRV